MTPQTHRVMLTFFWEGENPEWPLSGEKTTLSGGHVCLMGEVFLMKKNSVGKTKFSPLFRWFSDSCQFSCVFCVWKMVEKNKNSRAAKERLQRQEATLRCVDPDEDDPEDGPEVFEINKEEESKEEIFAVVLPFSSLQMIKCTLPHRMHCYSSRTNSSNRRLLSPRPRNRSKKGSDAFRSVQKRQLSFTTPNGRL